MLFSRRTFLHTAGLAASAGILSVHPDWAFAQASAPIKGGDLRIAVLGGSGDSLDPHVNKGNSGDLTRLMNLYDGLTEYASDGVVQLSLAESMESNDLGTEWTVRLRPGIKTHSGGAFTADDVIFSIQRILDPSTPAVGKALIKFIAPEEIEKVDDLTVKFNLSEPYGPFQELWANRYLRMVPKGFDPKQPISTGPFKYVSFTPNRESVFERFDDYFREPAWVDKLTVVNINDNTAAVNAVRGGQVDVAYTIPYSEARSLSGDASVKVLENPGPTSMHLVMRTDVAPFDDVRVRQAMRLIVNRKQMVAVALAGYGVVGNDMLGRTVAPCGDSTLAQREQNIDEAKRLLAEAGHENLTVELTAANASPGLVEGAQVFAQQAKKADVTVNVKVVELGTLVANYRGWPFAIDYFSDTYLPAAGRTLLPDAPFNTTHFNDPEFNELYGQAVQAVDQGKRCEIIAKMRQIEYDRGGNIIWGFNNTLHAHRSEVHGLEPYSIYTALYDARKLWKA